MLHCFQQGLGGNTVFKGCYFKHTFIGGAEAATVAQHEGKHSQIPLLGIFHFQLA